MTRIFKLLSKKEKEEDPSAARGALYQEIFNFSLGLQRPAERKWESWWVTSGLSANGWAVTQGSSPGPFWRCTQDKITLSVWINSSCGQELLQSYVLLQLKHQKSKSWSKSGFLIKLKNVTHLCVTFFCFVKDQEEHILSDRDRMRRLYLGYSSASCLFRFYHSGGTESARDQSSLMLMWEKHLLFN